MKKLPIKLNKVFDLRSDYKISTPLFQHLLLEKERGYVYNGVRKFLKTMFLYILNTLFTTYSFMLLTRVIGSWFPRFAHSKFMRFIGYYTDPYLNIFRKIIPPLGMMDISPMVAFFALQMIQWILFSILV